MPHRSCWVAPLLAAHILLLVLASTQFTIATVWFGDHRWTWNYFDCAHSNGFGYHDVSAYSLPVVLTYIAAYVAGLIAYLVAWRRGRLVIGLVGALVSAMGLVSFGIEGSHWFFDHNLSWIFSCPLVALPLSAYAIVRLVASSESIPPTKSSAR
jgi:hypothetical protein